LKIGQFLVVHIVQRDTFSYRLQKKTGEVFPSDVQSKKYLLSLIKILKNRTFTRFLTVVCPLDKLLIIFLGKSAEGEIKRVGE
jgi:hypothetical protein